MKTLSPNFYPPLGQTFRIKYVVAGFSPRSAKEYSCSKLERGLKPRDYILDLQFDSAMRGKVRNPG